MQFAIQAIHRLQSVSLEIEAIDVSDARRQAEARGYAVVAIRAARGQWLKGHGRAPFPLLQFNQSLLILLKAGLSVVEAIDTLAQRETRADARRVLEDLRAQLGMGMSLSSALERQPRPGRSSLDLASSVTRPVRSKNTSTKIFLVNESAKFVPAECHSGSVLKRLVAILTSRVSEGVIVKPAAAAREVRVVALLAENFSSSDMGTAIVAELPTPSVLNSACVVPYISPEIAPSHSFDSLGPLSAGRPE